MILRIVFAMLRDGKPYREIDPDAWASLNSDGARPGARLGGRRLDNAALAAYLTNAKQGRQRSFWGIVDSSTFTGNTLSPSDRAMRYRLMYCHSASIWMVSQYFGV